MPVIIEWTYTDGSKEIERFSAQVWRKDEHHFTKTFTKQKEVASIQIDPMRETADIDETNNSWNVQSQPSKFQLFKSRQGRIRGTSTGGNPMQRALK